MAVATNAESSPEALDALAREEWPNHLDVLVAVAMNPSATTETLRYLMSYGGHVNVRMGVAANPSIPDDWLTELSRADESEVAKVALFHVSERICARCGISPKNLAAIEVLRGMDWWVFEPGNDEFVTLVKSVYLDPVS